MPGPPELALCKAAKGEPVLKGERASSCLPSPGILRHGLGHGAPKEGPRNGKVTESRFI